MVFIGQLSQKVNEIAQYKEGDGKFTQCVKGQVRAISRIVFSILATLQTCVFVLLAAIAYLPTRLCPERYCCFVSWVKRSAQGIIDVASGRSKPLSNSSPLKEAPLKPLLRYAGCMVLGIAVAYLVFSAGYFSQDLSISQECPVMDGFSIAKEKITEFMQSSPPLNCSPCIQEKVVEVIEVAKERNYMSIVYPGLGGFVLAVLFMSCISYSRNKKYLQLKKNYNNLKVIRLENKNFREEIDTLKNLNNCMEERNAELKKEAEKKAHLERQHAADLKEQNAQLERQNAQLERQHADLKDQINNYEDIETIYKDLEHKIENCKLNYQNDRFKYQIEDYIENYNSYYPNGGRSLLFDLISTQIESVTPELTFEKAARLYAKLDRKLINQLLDEEDSETIN